MNSARYLLVDVFTGDLFGGNPLAVFVDGPEVPERLMQPIARELNLSETTYVLPPEDPDNDWRTPGPPRAGSSRRRRCASRRASAWCRLRWRARPGGPPVR